MLHSKQLSKVVLQKLIELVKQGAIIIAAERYTINMSEANAAIRFTNNMALYGKGKIIVAPYTVKDFENLGIVKEMFYDTARRASFEWTTPGPMPNLAICRRDVGDKTIYFVSNQNNESLWYDFSFMYKGLRPEIYNPVKGTVEKPFSSDTAGGFIAFSEFFEPFESRFIVFDKKGSPEPYQWDNKSLAHMVNRIEPLMEGWETSFKTGANEVTRKQFVDAAWLSKGDIDKIAEASNLKSWTEDSAAFIKYFSGTAVYRTTYRFERNPDTINVVQLHMKELFNIATVKVNGIDCGTVWTKPYTVDIKKALKQGVNTIEIEVTNTWRNRLIGDELLPGQKQTWVNSPYKLKDKPLLPAGIVGQVEILMLYGAPTSYPF
jgi:hypothetical protein